MRTMDDNETRESILLKTFPSALTASIAQLDLKPSTEPLNPDSVYLTY